MSFYTRGLDRPKLYCLADKDLPPNAMDGIGVIDLKWLQTASPENQLVAICKWFVARYTDPANVLPYNSREGGYIWVDGGPYYAREVIEDDFSGLVPDTVLEQAIDIIDATSIFDWSLIEAFDEDDGLYINDSDESIEETRENISRLINLLGHDNQTLNRLLFAAMISVLETYLWRTMSYVNSRPGMAEKIFNSIYTKKKAGSDKVGKQGRPDHSYEKKRELAEDLLAKFLWQDIGKVERIFGEVLGIAVNLSRFKSEKSKRHDIVHRFGKDKTGKPVYITEDEVKVLSEKVLSFCESIHTDVNKVLQNDSSNVDGEK